MSETADVLIVGGGVIGCSIAYQLSKRGARVTVVERRRLAEEASWASAGIISPPSSPSTLPGRAELERRSFEMYPALIAEVQEATGLSVERGPAGELSVALDDGGVAGLRRAQEWQAAQGFAVEWLDADEARRREPSLTPKVRGASWSPRAFSVRPHRLTLALARAARLRGATIREETPVLGLLTDGGRVTGARTPAGNLPAGQVVIAAGAWTAQVGAQAGVTLPTRPVRGQMLALADAEPPLRHIIHGPGGYLVPRADGAIAVGATVEEAGFDARVTPDGLTWLADLARSLAPALAGARVVAVWAGLRPAPGDDRPLLGRAPGYDNLWVASGHFRTGILWAAVTGDLLAASVLAGRPDPALAPFDPARFA
ncbi:MAG TPA: glycine oxidase ThiO [Thermomicrobiales bacterium]|nr:glycine oxidase ThiO [Thermomicrobiales bacterium]